MLSSHYTWGVYAQEKSMSAITTELDTWFREIAAKQRVLADRTLAKKNRVVNRTNPTFRKGDWILLYEPPVTHATLKRPWAVPQKLNFGMYSLALIEC